MKGYGTVAEHMNDQVFTALAATADNLFLNLI